MYDREKQWHCYGTKRTLAAFHLKARKVESRMRRFKPLVHRVPNLNANAIQEQRSASQAAFGGEAAIVRRLRFVCIQYNTIRIDTAVQEQNRWLSKIKLRPMPSRQSKGGLYIWRPATACCWQDCCRLKTPQRSARGYPRQVLVQGNSANIAQRSAVLKGGSPHGG